ncbi:MAG: hypothetical protein A3J62_00850 [Candidatus Buchananbacteria bacterium RIFCSPHIGHO2_02_FULL_38_8]|uniref:CMP/dCMP-type deaminase domain-containing protein n=2 Tax=Candidatus Buchananiibacteriota TaxID=1817903 RepID=A0A1G1XYE7_9BACT|nr:MAG: hypothetical protein A2731_00915 [Candidatus Buchananbacteria bacterium RIFCSPHIGHO2_01_FULL_39_8]OGY47744.1 MAG: hypothetical protein A3J62_00850 [Candidatus Buchananbacteria bacterium RIFCSPHIGHO2_02_FULL_38_8]
MKKREKTEHPSWEETFMQLAVDSSLRSHCEYVCVGAVIANAEKGHEMVLTTGYNGPPRSIAHCDEVGCSRRDQKGSKIPGRLCVGAHAEINSIANAAKAGIIIDGGALFVTLSPCFECAKHIINSGIKEVVYLRLYSDIFPDKKKEEEMAIELLRQAGRNCRLFKGKVRFETKPE